MEFGNETALLQEIHSGAEMGTASIALLLPKVRNAAFRSDLKTQQEGYAALSEQADQALARAGQCPKPLTAAQQFWLEAGVWCKTLLNQETSHLAKLMIQGSNMGILTLTGILNSYGNPKDDPAQSETESAFAQPPRNPAIALARQTIQFERENIDRLKIYLT